MLKHILGLTDSEVEQLYRAFEWLSKNNADFSIASESEEAIKEMNACYFYLKSRLHATLLKKIDSVLKENYAALFHYQYVDNCVQITRAEYDKEARPQNYHGATVELNTFNNNIKDIDGLEFTKGRCFSIFEAEENIEQIVHKIAAKLGCSLKKEKKIEK